MDFKTSKSFEILQTKGYQFCVKSTELITINIINNIFEIVTKKWYFDLCLMFKKISNIIIIIKKDAHMYPDITETRKSLYAKCICKPFSHIINVNWNLNRILYNYLTTNFIIEFLIFIIKWRKPLYKVRVYIVQYHFGFIYNSINL